MDDIGAKIRSLRRKKGWPQQILADHCSFPGLWTVSRLETRGTDSLSKLEIVCKALEVEVWELLYPTRIDEMMNTVEKLKREESLV